MRSKEQLSDAPELRAMQNSTEISLQEGVAVAIGGFHDKIDFRHNLGDLYLDLYSSLHVHGQENLAAVRELHAPKRKIMMIGNHRSNADAPVLEHSLEKHGYADISDDLVYLLGQRLKQNSGTNYFSMAYPHIDVWPPTMRPETDEEKLAMRRMTKNTLQAVHAAYDEGKIIVAFGEGTRTRDPNMKMGEFVPQIGHYLKGEDVHVVPFALMGTETVWPVDQKAPHFSRKSTAHLVVGEPFEAAEFMQGQGRERYGSVMRYTQEMVQNLLDEYSHLEQ